MCQPFACVSCPAQPPMSRRCGLTPCGAAAVRAFQEAIGVAKGIHSEDDVKICIADVEPDSAPEDENEAPKAFDAKTAWAKLSVDKRLALMRKAQCDA